MCLLLSLNSNLNFYYTFIFYFLSFGAPTKHILFYTILDYVYVDLFI